MGSIVVYKGKFGEKNSRKKGMRDIGRDTKKKMSDEIKLAEKENRKPKLKKVIIDVLNSYIDNSDYRVVYEFIFGKDAEKKSTKWYMKYQKDFEYKLFSDRKMKSKKGSLSLDIKRDRAKIKDKDFEMTITIPRRVKKLASWDYLGEILVDLGLSETDPETPQNINYLTSLVMFSRCR